MNKKTIKLFTSLDSSQCQHSIFALRLAQLNGVWRGFKFANLKYLLKYALASLVLRPNVRPGMAIESSRIISRAFMDLRSPAVPDNVIGPSTLNTRGYISPNLNLVERIPHNGSSTCHFGDIGSQFFEDFETSCVF